MFPQLTLQWEQKMCILIQILDMGKRAQKEGKDRKGIFKLSKHKYFISYLIRKEMPRKIRDTLLQVLI